MQLTSLGHSGFLVEMRPRPDAAAVRLLVDPWIRDTIVGDLQGRFPRIRLDYRALGTVHAVFLSHAHTDHLDPYSLVELWNRLEPRPALLLPESLRFLETLLREALSGVQIRFLAHREDVPFQGLSLMAFFSPETEPTNEDDVMVLVVRSESEVLLDEADALLPFYHPLVREELASLLSGPGIDSACVVTTRNEGASTMSMLAARNLEDRRRLVDRALERCYEEIDEMYAPLDDADGEGLWENERLVRLIAGQGICYPQALGADWNRVLFPIRLCDRVRMENEIAQQYEHRHRVEEFVAGQVHAIRNGRLVDREPSPFLQLLDREEDRAFSPALECFEDFPRAPLRDEPRDRASQAAAILDCLNRRFLPHLIGARRPPVEHLLGENGGQYRVRIRYGTTSDHRDADHVITFERLRFAEAAPDGDPDEHYWANDLEDFLAGRCDEFSTFCRRPLPAREPRLWRTLGLPYLNNDLVERKLRYHFERALRGESPDAWVLGFYGEPR